MPGWIIEGFELAINPTKLTGLCLQSPAGVRKEGSERNEAHRRPYCRKRGRSGVIVLLLVLLALAVTAAEGYQDVHVKMPPPPGGSMRQQLSEQDLRSIHRSTDDTMKYFETLIQSRREAAKRRREEAKEMDEEADELQERVKVLRQTLQGCAKQDQPEEGESPGEAQGPDTTQKLKLKFNGSLCGTTIYAKKSLLEYSNGPIEIAICRGDQIITSGDLSSLKVEIVVLEHGHTCKGDWTRKDFNRQIIRSGQGLNKVSVLDGEAILQLDRGKASLGNNIHFKEGSGGNSFILAARVCRSRNIIGTTRIEEAFMDDYPFQVLTERSMANKKIVIPKLDDEVHGLKGIKRNGYYDERLKKKGIDTVRKFLQAFNVDSKNLRCQILNIKSKNKKPWREMVEHARECDLRNDPRLKSCTLQKNRKVTLFFNVVHDLVGAEFSGCFVAKGEFNKEQEVVVDGLLKQAYQELNDTFDHIMKDNRPVNIHASINAAGSQSVPISAAENLGSASGIDCADGPLPGTAGQSAPEPSRSDHRNKIANQGENPTPRGVSVCRDRVLEELLALVIESNKSNPALDGSSGGNFDLSNNPTFGQDQAAGNSASASGNDRAPGAILGDANRNAARYRASEPSPPDHEATFQAAAAPGRQSQPSNALGFASTWNSFVDLPGQGTTFAALDQSQPSTAPGLASTRNLLEEPPVQGTTFAALDQSQPNTAPSFAFEDPPGQVNKSQQAYTEVNTQTIQDLRSMQMPSLQVEDGEQFVGYQEYYFDEQDQQEYLGWVTNGYGNDDFPEDY